MKGDLNQDGTVLSTAKNPVETWTNVVSVSGQIATAGLPEDKTVIATGVYEKAVESWRDIVDISASNVIIGLKSDGTVIATQYPDSKNYSGQSEVSEWKDIVAISAENKRSFGLKADGTVVTTKDAGSLGKTLAWGSIVAISSGPFHTLGLKEDGSVVADFSAPEAVYTGQCEVSSWSDIVSISAGMNHSVGLRADGTVVATRYTGPNQLYKGQCEVSSWTGIVAVFAGTHVTVGVKADGTVVATGQYEQAVSKWKLFDSIESMGEVGEKNKKILEQTKEKAEAERNAAAERAEATRQERIEGLNKEKAQIKIELPAVKGLFAGSKKAKMEARLAEIEAELKKLG